MADTQNNPVHKKHTEILRDYFNFLIKGCNDCKDNDRQIYNILDNVVKSVPKQLKKGKDYHTLISKTKSISNRELSPVRSNKDRSNLNSNKSKARLGPGRFAKKQKKIYNFNLKKVKSRYLGDDKLRSRGTDKIPQQKFPMQNDKYNDLETMEPEALIRKFLEIFTYGRNAPQEETFQNILNANARSRGGVTIEEFKLENKNNTDNRNNNSSQKTCGCETKRASTTQRTNSTDFPNSRKDSSAKSNVQSASCKVNNTKPEKDTNTPCKSGKGKKDDQDKNQDEGSSGCKRSDSPDAKPTPRFPPTLSPVSPCPVSKPRPKSCPSKNRNIQPEDVYVEEIGGCKDDLGGPCSGPPLVKKCGKKEKKPKKCKRDSDDEKCHEKPFGFYPPNDVMQCIMESRDVLNYWNWPLCMWRKQYCRPIPTFPVFKPLNCNLRKLPFTPCCLIPTQGDVARPWGVAPSCS